MSSASPATYADLLTGKIKLHADHGFDATGCELHPSTLPHQADTIRWALKKGRALIGSSFGLGKTHTQIELMRLIQQRHGGLVLIVCPLGVKHQFTEEDGPRLGVVITYVRNDAEAHAAGAPFLITNYERVRDGHFSPDFLARLTAVTLDEGSVLRSVGTETHQQFTKLLKEVPFRFVCTATPSPNRYTELNHYAAFLGVMDSGQALTRWFKRDSQKAGNLTLHPQHEADYWLWVSSWALFLTRPSDLGYSDEGYDLPALQVFWHLVSEGEAEPHTDSRGQVEVFHSTGGNLPAAAREKKRSIPARVAQALDIVLAAAPDDHWLIWHHLEAERKALEFAFGEATGGFHAVYGSQPLEERERLIMDFAHGQYQYLASKPELTGAGCNFQRHCHLNLFLGIDYRFEDFIQAVHRTHRFQQPHPVQVHILYTPAEEPIRKELEAKWARHTELMATMQTIIRTYGLSHEAAKQQLTRSLGVEREVVSGERFTAVRNDCVAEMQHLADNSVGLIHTSIPFGNHYEYSAAYEDFGHNEDNEAFFSQMDFLIPELHRVLKPGRLACIHVKDRVRYGSVTGDSFIALDPFSDQTSAAFRRHGFRLLGRITVLTDVVRENNQTYRLGFTEMCKDSTKMGVGLPEYILLLRKLPTSQENSYADEPVIKTGQVVGYDKNGRALFGKLGGDYPLSRWQVDAHAFWQSSGNRLLTPAEISNASLAIVQQKWRRWNLSDVYDYVRHVQAGEQLAGAGRLPSTFMLLPPQSKAPEHVWTDVNYMRSLNSEQSRRNLENHICLARGSRVLTKTGFKGIEEVVVGDLVLTHAGRWRPVTVVRNMGVRPVVLVKAHGVPGLTLTPEHELWTRRVRDTPWARNHSRQEARRVTPGWVRADETAGSYINLKLPPVEASDKSEALWWLAGRWLADGHVDARGTLIISCGRHEEAGLLEKLGSLAGAVNDTGTALQIRVKDPKGLLRAIIADCGTGAAHKHLPAEAFSVAQPAAKALLDGYLSGDGHYIVARHRWTASTVSKDLAFGIALLAQRVHGAMASIYPGRKGGPSTIQGRAVNTQPEWVICFDLPRENGGGVLPLLLDDGAWKRVKSVEDAGTAETWCLRVEEDESFTAEGCIVKNCPLPFDIVERLIERYSSPGDLVFDPFGGLMTVPYCATKLGRRGYGVELNRDYWQAGVAYCREAEYKATVPTLFDFMASEPAKQEGGVAA